MAPLLPKLRGHFAEFLNNASPAGLRILSSSTCVGLRYGYLTNNSSFSWYSILQLHYLIRSTSQSRLIVRFFLHNTCSACTGFPFPGSGLCHTSLQFCYKAVQESFTCCPSTTSFDLALGPDLPGADQLYPGNLGYSACRILTYISLLIPAFSLLNAPLLFSVQLRRINNAPLPLMHMHES